MDLEQLGARDPAKRFNPLVQRILRRPGTRCATITGPARVTVPHPAKPEELFDARIQSGSIVDGHGDLLAGDIFCLDDGPRILDCLDFDDKLRWLDGDFRIGQRT